MGQTLSHTSYGLKWYKVNNDKIDEKMNYKDEVQCQAKVLRSIIENQEMENLAKLDQINNYNLAFSISLNGNPM